MKHRVLLIDDSEFIHDFVRHALPAERFDLTMTVSGVKGVEIAELDPPDLILLDVLLPDGDGFSICEMLKSNPATASAAIIFLTGETRTDDKARGLGLGATDYLTKPFDKVELLARVSAALRTKAMMDALSRKAMVDGLTGLWNRSYFDERMLAELSMSRRRGQELACIILDVDHFKRVNDTYGHPAGDAVLKGVARVIADQVRREDIAARLGGEEFAVLVPQTPPQGGVTLAERLRAAIEFQVFEFQGRQLRVTCSFGVADVASTQSSLSLIDRADAALYQAKSAGRNRVVSAAA